MNKVRALYRLHIDHSYYRMEQWKHLHFVLQFLFDTLKDLTILPGHTMHFRLPKRDGITSQVFLPFTGLKFGVEYSDDYDDEDKPIPFRRRVFPSCLDGKHITGKNVEDLIKSKSFKKLDDDDVVSLCCIGILQLVLLGLEDRRAVPNWILRLANDRDGWDDYPWGSYVWPTLYYQLRDANVKRWLPLYATEPTNEDDKKSYSIFGFTWAFKTWILEVFRLGQNEYYTRHRRYPRIVAWTSNKKFYRHMLYDFLHGRVPAERLIPDEVEAGSEPIIADQHYGISDLSGFQSIQRPRRVQRPSVYIQSPYTPLPATTELPKKRVGKTKKNSKNDNLSPLNLGNAIAHDNVGGDDVLITGVHDTGSILHEDLTYTMLHEMLMKKFNLEANYPLNLSAKLSSFEDTFDITDDSEIKGFTAVESFEMLPYYCYNLERKNEGTITRIKTDEKGVFEMLFIALGASGLYKENKSESCRLMGLETTKIVPIDFGLYAKGNRIATSLLKFQQRSYRALVQDCTLLFLGIPFEVPFAWLVIMELDL
ncbi:hypothetical protein Tco_0450455 [Tanacetum coccineum]